MHEVVKMTEEQNSIVFHLSSLSLGAIPIAVTMLSQENMSNLLLI